ncbi:MAG: hypothetical protein ACYC7G_10075 [Rudaea sp.]
MKRILAIMLLITASSAFANAPSLVWCTACTDAQMQAAALNTPIGTTYVADLFTGRTDAFSVYYDDIGKNSVRAVNTNPSYRVKKAVLTSADPHYTNGINALVHYYNLPPAGWVKHLKSPVANDNAGSVYNIINAGPAQNSWVDGKNSPLDLYADYHEAVANATAALGSVMPSGGLLQVAETQEEDFSDGSRVDLVYDIATNKMKLDPDSARDSHNNSVPYIGTDGKIHNLGGEHVFSGDGNPNDQSNFLNQVQHLGVIIIAGVGGSGTQHGWACTKVGDGDNAVYTCQYY